MGGSSIVRSAGLSQEGLEKPFDDIRIAKTIKSRICEMKAADIKDGGYGARQDFL